MGEEKEGRDDDDDTVVDQQVPGHAYVGAA
jgi:hypothetical protein